MTKQKIIDSIIKIEGGFVNDPNDSGGATKFGITESVARANGYNGSMENLPYDLAFKIYEGKYWNALKLDEVEKLSSLLAEKLCDMAVNLGVMRAAFFLQRCLNVFNQQGKIYQDLKVDGSIGAKSISALQFFLNARKNDGVETLLKALNCLQGEFYISLAEKREKDEAFVYGWLKNRVK